VESLSRIQLLGVILLSLGVAVSNAPAQEIYGTLSGVVTGPSGAAVVGATVTAVNLGTNLNVSVTSGANGGYTLARLPDGNYRLTVVTSGFRQYSREPIMLRSGDKANVAAGLELGAATETVTVTAELSGIESRESVMAQTLNTRRIFDLPSNGRNYVMLLQLTSGVDSGMNYIPPPEAVQNMKVSAPTSDASLGMSGGGVVALTMRSGTNELHGALNHSLRNNILNANQIQINRALQTRSDLSQQVQFNNFAVMLSGPIVKNKLFYSGNYDGFHLHVTYPAREVQIALQLKF
jgi:hypothetical protein